MFSNSFGKKKDTFLNYLIYYINMGKIEFAENVEAIRMWIKAVDSTDRQQILDLTYKKPLKISDIGKKLKISDKMMWQHINILKEQDLIKLDKRKKEQGQPVFVTSIIDTKGLLQGINLISEHLYKYYRRRKK